MKRVFLLSLAFIALFIYLYYLSQVEVRIIPPVLLSQNAHGYYDYRGVTHAHTDFDIGSGDLPHVVSAAKEARLDFLFITVLNQFPSPNDFQSYQEGVLVLSAREYSYLDSHILYYPISTPPDFANLGQAQVYLTDLMTQKHRDLESGILTVAHPLRPGYSWEGEGLPGLNGVEVVNLKSIWESSQAATPLRFLWSSLILPFNSNLSFLRTYTAPDREEALWDTLNTADSGYLTFGYVGNNSTATAILFPKTKVKFPEYSVSFSLASNHILLESELTGDFTKDRSKVLYALAKGRFYLALDLLADPKGFFAHITDGSNTYPMGSVVPYRPGQTLHVELPAHPIVPFEVVLYRNGVVWKRESSVVVREPLPGPGVYRAIVRVQTQLPFPDGNKWIHWIYSNPFLVRKALH